MATKGGQNFWDKMTSPFRKKEEDPHEEVRNGQVVLAGNRKGAAEMIAKLRCIDFTDSLNKLPLETVKQEGYEQVVRAVINELNSPIEITRDISALDEKINIAIDAFIEAVKENYPTAAHWAAAAMYQGVSNLRQEIGGINAPYEEELYKKRLDYAINLELIVKASLARDAAYKELVKQEARHQKKLDQIQDKESWFEKVKRSAEGQLAIAELRQSAGNPMAMSAKAKEVSKELDSLSMLNGENLEIEIDIATKEALIEQYEHQIESARNRLAELPTVTDPQLQVKLKRAMEVYRDNLRDTHNRIKDYKSEYFRHLSEIEQLTKSDVFTDQVVSAIRTMDQLEVKKQKDIIRSQQVAAQAQKELERKRQEEEQRKVLRKLTEEMEQIEERVEETETEAEVLTEFEPE